MLLLMISIDSCIIIHRIVQENVFILIAHKLSLQKKILKCHIRDCFKINGKQTIKMPKKSGYVKFKNFERKTQSPFMIYADFESILAPEDNGKQNPNESYTNKYQKHVVCSYGYKVSMVNLVNLLNHT